MSTTPVSKTSAKTKKRKSRAKTKTPEQRVWRPFPRPLGVSVAKVARPLVGKRGFTEIDILSRWADIVGGDLASFTLPEKLIKPRSPRAGSHGLMGGTLHIRVANSASATLLKYQEAELAERINAHFGYTVVSKIQMKIGKIPKPRRAKPPPPPPQPLREDLADLVATVDDPELQEALVRLGQALPNPAKDS